MDKKINHEESNEEPIEFVSNPFLPLPTVCRTSVRERYSNEMFLFEYLSG
jgi:hypothetical protein